MLGHVDHDGMFRIRTNLRGVGAFQLEHVPGEFYHGRLEAEADAQERFVVDTAPLAGLDLALDASLAEPSGDHDATGNMLIANFSGNVTRSYYFSEVRQNLSL